MNEEIQGLSELYKEAWADGVWFREWETEDGRFMAAAGFVHELEAAERRLREEGRLRGDAEITPLDLSVAEMIFCFTTFARVGASRVAACRAAWERLRRNADHPQ